jgi:diguanylate cyclase (GGDEF)-like protein
VILLDPATVILTSTLMAAAMSIVLLSASRSYPAEVRGLGHWALGMISMTLAGVVLAGKGLLPEAAILFLANSALLLGGGLLLVGTQRFYGRAASWWWLALAWICGMACLVGWYLIRQDYGVRVAVFSLLTLSFYVPQLLLTVRYGGSHFSNWFFGAMLLVQSVVLLLRTVVAMHGGMGENNYSTGPVQSVYLLTANFMTLLMAVGFITVATRRLQTVMEHRSNSDPLTGVLNRRGFAEVFGRELARIRRRAEPMSLLSIDLDFFKAINDRYGHAVGDQVLVHAAHTCTSALREIDHVARFGGEEFIVLLPLTGSERALAVAQRIQALLSVPRDDTLPAYTVSVGIASQRAPDEGMDALMARADAALYRAKAGGRNRCEVA